MEEKRKSAWKAVWALTDAKGERGVGVKKGKAQHHAHHLKTGRWKLVVWSDDVRAGKGPCSITADVQLFGANDAHVGSSSVEVKKAGFKAKLNFVVAEEGDNLPARAAITISCGALVKKVKVFAVLAFMEGLKDESKFEPEDALWDTSKLSPAQKAHVASVLAEWPLLEGQTPLTFDNSRAIKELARDSEFKQMAYEQGMIRPFLLLASMHPKRRAIWAKTLDLDLLRKPFFGDSHAEAWFIIDKDRAGIQARSNLAFKESLNPFARSCNWYEIVERVTRKAFNKDKNIDEAMHKQIKEAKKTNKQTIGPCQDPTDHTVPRMEELFMRAFSRVMLGSFPEQQRQVIDQLMDQDDAKELAERMLAAGWTDTALIRFTVAQAIQGSAKEEVTQGALHFVKKMETGASDAFKIGLPAVMLFISPIPAIPAVMLVRNTLGAIWGSTPGRLIPSLIGILGQRSWLSLAGIRIEDYYPSLTA